MFGRSPFLAALCALALPPACSARVAVVTGATRGIGRGIAIELGRLGHTVYVLGRSTRGRQTSARPVAAGLDLTVESTAEAVTAEAAFNVTAPKGVVPPTAPPKVIFPVPLVNPKA